MSLERSHRNPPSEWIRKRKQTTISFCVQSFLMGCEYGIFIVNLWLYITELVETDHPRRSYSMIAVAYLISASIWSVVISWLADRTREIQKITFFTNTMFIVGNIVYMIPFSSLFLLCGRIVAGIGQPGRSVMAGELARCYPKEQTTYVFSMLGAAYGLGFMLAPGLNVVFSALDFTWGDKLHVTYANVSGFYMGVLFLLAQIMHLFLTSDLSKEFDLKSEQEVNPEDEAVEGNKDEEAARPLISKPESKVSVIRLSQQLFTNPDTFLLLCVQLMESYVVLCMDLCLPMLIVSKLHWSHASYNGMIIATSALSLCPSIYLFFRKISDKTMLYIAIPSMLTYGLMQLIQIIWQLKLASKKMNIVLAVTYCIMFTDLVLIREVFVGSFLARMVRSRYQSTVDSVRLAMSRVGAIAAMLSAPFALTKIDIVGPFGIGVTILLGILLFCRRRTMKKPTVVIY